VNKMNFFLSKLHLFIAKFKLTNPKGLISFLMKLGISLSVIVAGIVFAIRAQARSQTKTKTQQQADLLQEMAHQHALDAQLTEDEKEKQQYLDRAQAAQVIADRLKDDVATLDAEHKREQIVLDGLKSWQDVDQHIVPRS
jgi:Tfp pilus assembly protein PilN